MVVPPLVTPTTVGTLGEIPARNRGLDPDYPVIRRGAGKRWADVTAAMFADDVSALAKGMVAMGLPVGSRVAIISRTRYEWTLIDFACWQAGLVVVPIYETSSPTQIAHIIRDAGVIGAFVENSVHRGRILEVRDSVPSLRYVWELASGVIPDLEAAGESVTDEALAERVAGMDRSSLATVIYTSGTTGDPKGCELTHGNFLDLIENATAALGEVVKPGSATLLFLPIAHVFARFIQVLAVHERVTLGHVPDTKTLMDDLGGFRPTFLLAVPRVLEKVYNSSEQKAAAGGKAKVFHWAARVAISWSKHLDTGRIPLRLKVAKPLADKLVFSKLRAALGGKAVYVVSGGAPLGARLGHFYRGIGLIVLEGYGLTETTAPATVNTPELIKIGTVGCPLPGVGIRIDEDGEVLISGVNVFRGYHGAPERTQDVIVDGWFHTGDLGELDSDGYLKITGRKKELLVTAGGKNVPPSLLEDRLRAHPLVSQTMVVGDKRPYIAALVTLDAEMVPTWAKNHGLGELDVNSARTNERVLEEIQRAVDYANRVVSQAESIRKFTIVPGDFTEEAGHLTPSLKMRRDRVMRDFETFVNDLYGGSLDDGDA